MNGREVGWFFVDVDGTAGAQVGSLAEKLTASRTFPPDLRRRPLLGVAGEVDARAVLPGDTRKVAPGAQTVSERCCRATVPELFGQSRRWQASWQSTGHVRVVLRSVAAQTGSSCQGGVDFVERFDEGG